MTAPLLTDNCSASSTIRVALPANSYDITIAAHLLDRIGVEMSQLKLGEKVLLVSNPVIFKHYGDRALKSLQAAGFDTSYHLIPPGERHKTLNSIQKLYDTAIEKRLERSSTLMALGGGVVGDMTGFAAATWLRGINFVQVPTSLLAMVDASIGGKTGVNHPRGKNLIGAFYQPKWVAIDPVLLETLPPREFRAGMAEVIKYGVIWDKELFEKLEASNSLKTFRNLEPELLEYILLRSCQAKADVASKDEKEAGLRAILNYGHTIGHALESLTGYRSVNHGEAVGLGMVAAGEIALALEMWSEQEAQRQRELIVKAGLPAAIPANLEVEGIIKALALDKKVQAGRVRFILPTRLGEVTICDRVSPEILRPILQRQQEITNR